MTREGQLVHTACLLTLTTLVIVELPEIEHASIHVSERTLDYRLSNTSFLASKVPLCLRMEIYNRTNVCERIVTSSGVLKLDDNDLLNIVNVSICLDQYDDYCGKNIPVEISKRTAASPLASIRALCNDDLEREVSFNWIFILIASILVVFFLILCGLCIFCFVQNCKRRRNINHNISESTHIAVMDRMSNVLTLSL